MQKNALLIFSKPPIAGLVKTRLVATSSFTSEQAADFYKRCLFDVAEMAMHALIELEYEQEEKQQEERNQYHFFISTTPEQNKRVMQDTFESLGEWPKEIHYITDEGKTFDDHFDDAINQLKALDYDNIVAIGGDLPTMPKSHIKQAFAWLEYFNSLGKPGFVCAPCQECGTSLIGVSKNTPINNQGIYYNMNGRAALDGYIEKIKEQDIPLAYLSPVADIDESVDFSHAISCIRAIAQAAKYQEGLYVPRRVLDWIDFMNMRVLTPPNENHDPRQYVDK